MSHKDEKALQEADDKAYAAWLKKKHEESELLGHWCALTNTLTARVIVPDMNYKSYSVSGEIRRVK